ncbi:16S rRNA (guanine(527)-N(7))-methyltransferase RsmG [Aestuariispira insulae]|uniref:Ribosomal RNA small subunit methyltransferase G n=1 Tax=Aestuariispira insulae TaxID=1461337 RepID=A0A3D9HPC2_9PROT|nr:16S rRNA (guanine(527)-N(7))-methyltransferase RsmG [Aestuariispira insulae]RED51354.1 16S rRNA m(7)G-527 methyltransferase [Aestuariispira insulae]
MTTMTADAFQALTDVSCETLEKLKTYAALLEKWQKKINLVGPKTIPDLWERHMLDSAQVFEHIPDTVERLVDIGSGAGFPGLVLAILGVPDVHLIESDGRKCAFLREVARATDTPVTIHNKRIETVKNLEADVCTARALASIKDLLTYAKPLIKPQAPCIFLKGKRIKEELTEANYIWHIKEYRIPSRTDSEGSILFIKGFSDVREITGTDHQAE